MSDRWCSVRARLQPSSNTAALLRVVSILHSRGIEVQQLSFETRSADATTMTALVRLGNAGWPTLRASLLRPVEVIDVDGRLWEDDPAPATSSAPAPPAVVEHRLSLLGQPG